MRVVAVVVVVLVLALPSWAAEPRRATLQLESTAPLIVHGLGFGAGERVVVIAAVTGAQRIVEVKARRDGRFVARFAPPLARCAPLTFRAIGALGSRAILRVERNCKGARGKNS